MICISVIFKSRIQGRGCLGGKMKKFINNPSKYVSDTLSGIYRAHSDKIHFVNNDMHCMVKKDIIDGKVGIVSGGGSGHLPLFLGYVGDGMLDGCAVGDVFHSPNSEQIYEVTRAVDSGKGVLYIIGNYNGDIFNFTIASRKVFETNDINTTMIIVNDDLASSDKSVRRGIAGLFFVFKCAGAAAAKMKSLEEVKTIAEMTLERTRSLGVALSPCIIPETGMESFLETAYSIEFGVGIHGERGIQQSRIMPAKRIAKIILEKIIEDLELRSGDRVGLLVNGLGGTPLEEQYIIYNSVFDILFSLNINVSKVFLGEFATTLEMAGISISVLKLNDQLEDLLLAPADTIMYKQGDI